ncbi:MAG: hypothetical protein ABIA63_00130, partial [bacterium]
LSKSDAIKLARLMTDPKAEQNVKKPEGSAWLNFIDYLALKLGFVSYNTKGEYMGYHSSAPCFPDNYIKFESKTYEKFLESSMQDQERYILNALINDYRYDNNELIKQSVFGILDTFSYHGCATGVMPTLDFSKTRKFVFNVLKECESGAWYSTAFLINYLKNTNPFFLIPKDFTIKDKWNKKERYGNFKESKDQWGYEIKISDNQHDAFERVEGRYIERFLENIPLTMRYIDVAYCKKDDAKIYPLIGKLMAFKVHERFLSVMKGEISKPKVTIQPNFEIHVDSKFYPAKILSELTPLAQVISDDVSFILKLNKEKVAAQLIKHENLDVPALLRDLTGKDIPQNVLIELEEWAGHSEIFTLYKGFALLEGDQDLPVDKAFIVENLSPHIRMVRSPKELFTRLQSAEMAPMMVNHSDNTLQALPREVRTVFAKKSQAVKSREKPGMILKKQKIVTLYLPETDLLERFCKELLNAGCRFESQKSRRTISFSKNQEHGVQEIIKSLKKEYNIRIQEIE